MLRVVNDSPARLMSREIFQVFTAFPAIDAFKCFVYVCACYDVCQCGVELHSAPPYVLIFGMWLWVCTPSAVLL